jgi:thiol-disulfide isomerase/thioredoxin
VIAPAPFLLLLAAAAAAPTNAKGRADVSGARAGGGHASSGIRWERHFEEALRKARSTHKPLMIDFWAEWCGWCQRLDQTTYLDPDVIKLADGFVAVKINSEGSPREQEVALRYDVASLPTIAFVSPGGRLITRLTGYQGPGQFPRTLEVARQMAGRVMGWEDSIDRNAEDATALGALGVHLYEQDAYRDSKPLLSRAVRVDGHRPLEERKRNRLLLAALEKVEHRYPQAETLIQQGLAMTPSPEYDAKLLMVLGKVYASWGRLDEARVVLTRVVQSYPQTPVAEKARETLVALDARRK